MPPSVTPSTLLLRQIDDFIGKLPEVRDGLNEAIHDARVGTRRMRELLPLVAERLPSADTEQLEQVLRGATKRLGRARDLEVKLQLLASLETAAPTAGELGRLRLLWREERDRLVRRAIKTLERLDIEATLESVRRSLQREQGVFLGLRRHGSAAPRWDDALAVRLRERAGDAADAIGRAGGVLFPNRLHAARVAVKKLRYAMEIATATGRMNFERELRPMRKAQELLGRIHDHDELAESLRKARLGAQRLMPLIQLDRHRLHARYLRRREALLDVCQHAAAAATRDHRVATVRRAMIAASVPLAVAAVRGYQLAVVNRR